MTISSGLIMTHYDYKKLYTLFYTIESVDTARFEDGLAEALSNRSYSRLDLLEDIRSALNIHRESVDQNPTNFDSEIPELIASIREKARICVKLGLQNDLVKIILTEYCEVWSFDARLIMQNDFPRAVSIIMGNISDLARQDYTKIITSSFALGLIENVSLETLREAKLRPLNIKDFHKLTDRKDVLSLLSHENKKRVASDELGL